MTELQDQLAQQTHPLTAAQIAAVENHAARSESTAAPPGRGPTPCGWRPCVATTTVRPGRSIRKTEAQQMARLVQRADIFGARLAPRAARWPMPVTAAMQASYYDEEQQADEAGAALVKTLGVYPPGAFVRLASREVGVVDPSGHHRHHAQGGRGDQPRRHAHRRAHPARHGHAALEGHRRGGFQRCAGQAIAGPPAADGLTAGHAPGCAGCGQPFLPLVSLFPLICPPALCLAGMACVRLPDLAPGRTAGRPAHAAMSEI